MADELPEPTTKYKKHRMGWLSPKGDYYPCEGLASHYGLSCALLKKFHPRIFEKTVNGPHARVDDELQLRGWIRVGAMMSYNYGFVIWKKPTQRQLDAIWDYCTTTKVHMPSRAACFHRDMKESTITVPAHSPPLLHLHHQELPQKRSRYWTSLITQMNLSLAVIATSAMLTGRR